MKTIGHTMDIEWLEEFRESMSWFRKCCIEWGEEKTVENHGRMIDAQIELFYLVQKAVQE